MFKFCRDLFLLLFLILPIGITPALALEISTNLRFEATGALWDTSAIGMEISTTGSTNLDLGITDVGVSYDIGVSSGTANVLFEGDLIVDYDPVLLVPGATTLSLDFLSVVGDDGNLQTNLGAWVDVQIEGSSVIDEGPSLNIDKDFIPKLDSIVSASDSTTVGGAEVPLVVAAVGANVEIEQTTTFEATAIDGLLAYSLAGSSTFNTMPFYLDTTAGLTFDVDLLQEGTWDFWFTDMALDNFFSTPFDVELVLYEEHTVITWDTSCSDECDGWNVLGVCLSWHESCVDFFTTTTVRNDFTLLELDLYDVDPFALDFNTISTDPLFSIDVESAPVPEPATILLLGSGLLGLGWYGRKRKKA